MTDNPVQSRKCGAFCRTTGQPCRTWAMANGRCRMHSGRSPGRAGRSPGAPRGEAHPNYRHGKFTRQTKELGKWARGLAEAGESLLAVTLDDAGLGRKLPKSLRRRVHIKKARAAAKKAREKAE
jgi:hypothetical protein